MLGLRKVKKIDRKLRLLILADCHHAEDEEFEQLRDITYDAVIFLGDIKNSFLQRICEIVKGPMYGVLGNHDGFETIEGTGIVNMHGTTINIGGLTIAGWQGSFKYKHGDYPSFTQEDSMKFAKELPAADILISHDSPYRLYGENSAHIGLKGISRYIKNKKIPLNIHGHQHVNRVMQLRNGTAVICVYRAAIMETDSLAVQVLF